MPTWTLGASEFANRDARSLTNMNVKYRLAETKVFSSASSTSPIVIELGLWNLVAVITEKRVVNGEETWEAVELFGDKRGFISGNTKARRVDTAGVGNKDIQEKEWNILAAFREFERNSYTSDELSNVPLSPYVLRYTLIGILTFATCATVTFLGGFLASFLGGGLDNPGGDAAFGIGCFISFWIGLVLSFVVRASLVPKQYRILQEKRDMSVFKGLFCTAIVGIGIGMEVDQLIHQSTPHSISSVAVSVLIMCSVGAIPTALCAVVWMAIEDGKNKKHIVGLFDEWRRQTNTPTISICADDKH